jgi:hypothetical protein
VSFRRRGVAGQNTAPAAKRKDVSETSNRWVYDYNGLSGGLKWFWASRSRAITNIVSQIA